MRQHPTFGEAKQIIEETVEEKLEAALADEHAKEDVRANHRNKNRVLMLLVAAGWSFTLPILVTVIFGAAFLASIAAFLLFITLIPDLFLSLYSYFRKY